MFKKNLDNQTEFASEAPFLTEPDLAEIDPEIAAKEAARKKLIKKIVFISGVILVLLAVVMIVISIFMPKHQPKKIAPTPTPKPTPIQVDQSLLGRAQALKQELELNDPSDDVLYFPNVSRLIYLDEPKRY